MEEELMKRRMEEEPEKSGMEEELLKRRFEEELE
jgi:hypothetical protein